MAESESNKSIANLVNKSKNIFNIDLSYVGQTRFINKKNSTAVNANIYTIRLSRLLEAQNAKLRRIVRRLFRIKRSRDLVHTVCALYDNALPDIGPSSVYDCICSKKAYTVCVVKENEPLDDDDTDSVYEDDDCLTTVQDAIETPDGIFYDVFSDASEPEEDVEDEDENPEETNTEDDCTMGAKSYIDKNNGKKKENKCELVSSLIACSTLQRISTFQLPGQDEWVIDLQLMSVRKNYRNNSIGKYLVNLIQNKNFVGPYDAIITCSDSEAIEFYEKYGFSRDPILNSKYSNIGDLWTNTTKMCFIPPYCSLISQNNTKLDKQIVKEIDEHFSEVFNPLLSLDGSILNETELDEHDQSPSYYINELTHMERDVKRWQKLMFSAYQSQAQIFNKLKQEVLTLKAKLCAKESIIDELKLKNESLIRKNKLLKMELGKSLEFDEDQLAVENLDELK